MQSTQFGYQARGGRARNHQNCDHNWAEEFYLGARTGDIVCTRCGEDKPKR